MACYMGCPPAPVRRVGGSYRLPATSFKTAYAPSLPVRP
jgi:hypothetical protein